MSLAPSVRLSARSQFAGLFPLPVRRHGSPAIATATPQLEAAGSFARCKLHLSYNAEGKLLKVALK